MHKSYISKNFKGEPLNTREFCIGEGYNYEEVFDSVMEALLSEPFLTRRMKMLNRPDGFMFYDELGVDFFSISGMLNPNIKDRLQLIGARPNFYMISNNPNVSLRLVDCSFYTRRFALKVDH